MVDWVLKRTPQGWLLASYAPHPLVLVCAIGTHHPNSGLKNLLKVLSGIMGKRFTKEPRDGVGPLAEAWSQCSLRARLY